MKRGEHKKKAARRFPGARPLCGLVSVELECDQGLAGLNGLLHLDQGFSRL